MRDFIIAHLRQFSPRRLLLWIAAIALFFGAARILVPGDVTARVLLVCWAAGVAVLRAVVRPWPATLVSGTLGAMLFGLVSYQAASSSGAGPLERITLGGAIGFAFGCTVSALVGVAAWAIHRIDKAM